MREVGDRTMAVLEIECIEELFGALGTDLGQRFAHRKSRTGVLGHGVGQHLRVGAVDGKDIGLVMGAGGTELNPDEKNRWT